MFTMTFRNFLENMWGNIPTPERKPSDGQPFADKMTDSKSGKTGGGAAGGMGAGILDGAAMPMKKMKKMKK
jgi:hypothetical protein